MDHGGGDAGAVAAIFGVNVLDHLLAPLMLEIDVDVGRLLALLADEAFEQQIAGRRVDRGNAERVADRAVRRRPAPLAQDRRVEASSEGDDVVDGQKIACEIELLDQREFVGDLRFDPRWNAIGPAGLGAFAGQMLKIILGRAALGHGLERIFIFQFVEAEAEHVGERSSRRNGVRPAGEQKRHFLGRFEVPLAIGIEQIAGAGQGHFLADAGHHVLQRAPLGCVIMDIIGGEDRAALGPRDPVEPLDPRHIVTAIEMCRGEVAQRRESLAQQAQFLLDLVEVLVGPGNEGDALGVRRDFIERDAAFALLRSHLAPAEKGREPAITVAVDGISEEGERSCFFVRSS